MNKHTQQDKEKRIGTLNQSANLDLNRANVEWVNISEVLPNPLNPRKDDAVKTEEMQAIIKQRGWEEPLTVYRKGKMYVLLSGHRRYFAARQAGIKQVPVFITEAPTSHQNEIERIASLQSGRVDWTAFEWARFTYERWIAWGQPPINAFAKQINLAKRNVEAYVQVLDYFPMDEIQAGLKSNRYSIFTLHELWRWMRDLRIEHPVLVGEMTEEMIRKTMLDKVEQKLTSKESLRKLEFLATVPSKNLKDWLLSKGIHLEQFMENNEFDVKEKSFQSSIISMGWAKKNIQAVSPKTKDQAVKSAEKLQELKKQIDEQLKVIERKFPESVWKDELL